MKIKMMISTICVLMFGTLVIADFEHTGTICSSTEHPAQCSKCLAQYIIGGTECPNSWPQYKRCWLIKCTSPTATFKTCLDSDNASNKCLMDITFPDLITCTNCNTYYCGCANGSGICAYANCSCEDAVFLHLDSRTINDTCT